MKLDQIPTLEQIYAAYPNTLALLFDMDGTLFDSEGQHAVALHHTFKAIALGEILKLSPIEIRKQYIGMPDPHVFDELVRNNWLKSNISLDHFLDLKKSFLHKTVNELGPKDLIVAPMEILLGQVKKAVQTGALKVGLVSASERHTIHSYLKQAELSDFFQVTISRDDCLRSKPDPMPYVQAMQALGVRPNETLIMEDSPTGLKSARATGAHMIHAGWFSNHS
ncbi:MAG: HAD family phosphatase [Bdellovibrio sp.]|nr:HAD family phosphatase [Bdellovibrio sp.]